MASNPTAVIDTMDIIAKFAPLIQGIWTVLAVVIAAVIGGAVWVTRIQIAVQDNTTKINEGALKTEATVDDAMCQMHRTACDKQRDVELTSIGRTLDDIKDNIKTINDRHERYQEQFLRSGP